MFGWRFNQHRMEEWAAPELHKQMLEWELERRRQRLTFADDAIRFFVWVFWGIVGVVAWPFRRGRPRDSE